MHSLILTSKGSLQKEDGIRIIKFYFATNSHVT